MKKPVCPHCNTEMRARYFVGYYEKFSFWACDCEVIPGSTIEAGSYSHEESGQSVEEYFGERNESY
jgi:hypothetical protein